MGCRAYLKSKSIISDNTEATGYSEPVSVAELKLFLQIEGTAYDSQFEILIKAARRKIENYCDISLTPKLLYAIYQTVGLPSFRLPLGPVDPDSTVTVDFKDCCDWEETDMYAFCVKGDEIKFNSTVGLHKITYSTLAAENMDLFRQAIMIQAGYMYTHRDDLTAEWSPQAKAMIEEERRVSV